MRSANLQRRPGGVIRRASIAAYCAILVTAMVSGLSADTPESPYRVSSDAQVIGHLLQSVNWYRHGYAERQVANAPSDLMFLDDNRAIELQILKLSFEFAKADAAMEAAASSRRNGLVPSEPSSSDFTRFKELKKRNDEVSQKALQEIEILNERIRRARDPERQQLKVALEDTESRLQLLQGFAQTVDDLIEFAKNARAGQDHPGNLDSTIDELARSIPEVSGSPVLSETSSVQRLNSSAPGADGGILGLASNVSQMNRKLYVVDEKIRLTSNLMASTENLRRPLAALVTQLMQSVTIIDLQTGDLPSLREQKLHFDTVTLELKGLSPAIVALDKQKVLLAECQSHSLTLRTDVAGECRQAWKKLVVRLLVVVSIVGLLLVTGAVSRRFTLRRVQDPNRRRLVGMIHWSLTLFGIGVVILFVLASELKSVVTYVGLLSAGLLVALQNVILACLGALVLIGKRGIRIGDRVQVAGITGDVMNMGLLQFQLKEFDLEKQRFTGHVATFSNSLVIVAPAIGLLKFNSSPEHKIQGAGPDAE